MSDPVEIALITASGFVLSSALSGIVILLVKRLDRKVAEVETKVDGRLSELLNLTRKSSHAEGVREGEKNGKEH